MKIKNLILKFFVNTDLQRDILFLRGMDFFEELSISQLKKLHTHMYKKTYLQKEIIYKKGQEAKLLCIVRSGKIELDDGKSKKIIYKRGLFGQKYAFNSDEVYTNTATALEDSKLFFMYKDDIETLMKKDNSIGFNMFKKISKVLYKRENNEGQ